MFATTPRAIAIWVSTLLALVISSWAMAAPVVTSFSPGSGAVGDPITINGTGFSATPSADTVKFNGVAVPTSQITSATTIKLVVHVPTGATTGKISVTVGSGTGSSSSNFTVTLPPPTFSPTSGVYGTAVTINGSGFSTTAASNTVKFNGTQATVNTATATQLSVTVPSAATTGTVTVTVGTLTGTSTSSFTIPSPTIGSFPSSGVAGSQVTISGTNFSPVASDNTVTFHGTAATVVSSTSIQIVAVVPPTATTGTIKITVGSHSVTSTTNFTVIKQPTISGFIPSFGPAGTQVSVNGTNFSSTATNDSGAFNGLAATVTSASTSNLGLSAPSGVQTGPISVTVSGATGTSATPFVAVPGFSTQGGEPSFRPGPDAFSPTHGSPGTLVAIRIPTLGAGSETVAFNGTAAQTVATNLTDIFVLVPSGATTGPIQLGFGYGQTVSSSTNFFVDSSPNISGIDPLAAPVGATVTLQGKNFGTSPSANTVTINGVSAPVSAATANQLTITVPSGATSGMIQVSANGGSGTSVLPFAVVAAGSNTNIPLDGISAQASASSAGQSLMFNFAGTQNQNLGLAISNLVLAPASQATSVSVKAPDGSTFASLPCPAGCTIELSNLPQSGNYTVVVSPNTNSIASAVATLTSQSTASLNGSTASTIGLTRLGQIARITFAANAGDSYGLEFANFWVVPSEVVQLKVLKPDGTLLGSVAQSDGGKYVFPLVHLPTTGTYTVIAQPLSAATATSFQATLLAPASIGVGTSAIAQDTNQVGQTGLLTFAATAGQQLDIRIENNTSFGTISPTLYAPDGSVVQSLFEPNYAYSYGFAQNSILGCSAGFGVCQLNFTASTTGNYVLDVAPTLGVFEPGPAFVASIVAATSGSLPAAGTLQTLNIGANQSSRLTFTGTAGQNLQLKWGAISNYSGAWSGGGYPNPTITVLNPDGSPLTWLYATTTGYQGVPLTQGGAADIPVLPSSGVYTVLVDFPPDSVGSIQLGLTPIASGVCTETDGTLITQTTLSVSPASIVAGSNYTVSATESDCNHTTGIVTVYDDIGDSCSIDTSNPNSCTFPALRTGPHRLLATYSPSTGAQNFLIVSSATASVAAGSSAVKLALQVTPQYFSSPGTFSVQAILTPVPPATAAPSGVIQIGNCTITLPNTSCNNVLISGTRVLTAQYFGDAIYAPTSGVLSFTNSPLLLTSMSIVDVQPEPSAWQYPYSVTVKVVPPFATGTPPTGVVTVYGGFYDFSFNQNTCTFFLPDDDGCTLSAPGPYVATAPVTAAYSGDSVYAPTSTVGSVTHHIVLESRAVVSLTRIAIEPSAVGQGYTVSAAVAPIAPATATPTGTVTIKSDTTSCQFSLPATGCSLTEMTSGTVSVVAEYSGDSTYAGAVSDPLTHAITSPGGPGTIPAGHEVCGFDPNSPYPPPSGFVPVSQLRGALFSPGLDVSIEGAPGIQINYPPPNATTYNSTVDVYGTVTGPLNTGVVVNGVVAPVVNGHFAVAAVPLAPGQNGIFANATTLTGLTASTVVSLNYVSNGASTPVSITTVGETGAAFSPFIATFAYTIGSLPNGATVASVAIDLNGDGAPEYSGASLQGAPTTFRFANPGVYTPTITVVDSNNQTYVSTTRVTVRDLAVTRGIVCDVFGYLKSRLNQEDVAGAVQAFQPSVQAQYQSLLSTEDPSNLPSIAQKLGTIANGYFGLGYAELLLIRDNSDQSRSGFPLRVTLGTDGIWRVSEM